MISLDAGIGAIAGAALAAATMYLVVVPIERADAKRGLVAEVRATAAEAKASELERQVNAGRIVIDAYQAQLKNVRAQQAVADAEEEQRNADYAKRLASEKRSCGITDADRKFLYDGK